MNKVIYTDCDGVLVNWLGDFYRWCHFKHDLKMKSPHVHWNVSKSLDITDQLGRMLIAEFNQSIYIETCKPYKDAIKYIRKLHEEHGFTFIVITHMGIKSNGSGRLENLDSLFGKDVISELIVTHEKEHFLKSFKKAEEGVLNMGPTTPVYWIEDNAVNAKIGKDLGYHTLLMDHIYNEYAVLNEDYDERVSNWKEIYGIITGERIS